jgi:STE24 endopeptidase
MEPLFTPEHLAEVKAYHLPLYMLDELKGIALEGVAVSALALGLYGLARRV